MCGAVATIEQSGFSQSKHNWKLIKTGCRSQPVAPNAVKTASQMTFT